VVRLDGWLLESVLNLTKFATRVCANGFFGHVCGFSGWFLTGMSLRRDESHTQCRLFWCPRR
jgi:hypothetical protein